MKAVTGATGFLGAHVVCSLLLKGHKVKAFKRGNSSLQEFYFIFSKRVNAANTANLLNNLIWVEADILDIPSIEEALVGVDEVYHCAALVSFIQRDKEKLMQVNVIGTANMVNAALSANIKNFCYVSSVAALGRRKSGELITEDASWENSKLNSNYAVSKYKAELEVWRGKEEGLNVCIVNPTVILGIGSFTKGSNHLLEAVSKGMPFYTLGVNGYVDAEDVADCMVKLMEQKIFGQRFITVSECVSNKELFNLMATHLGKQPPKILVNKWKSELAWRLVGMLRFLGLKTINITRETARASQNKSYYSNQKILNTICFTFKPLEQTIKESCQAFLSLHTK